MLALGVNKCAAPLGRAVTRAPLALSYLRVTAAVASTRRPVSGSSPRPSRPFVINGGRKPFAWSGYLSRQYSDGGDHPEHVRVNLPALSPTMTVGTIVSWEKKEGDAVAEGDLLCEIETDKATMGFETPEEGYLAKIILPSGSKDVPIGRLLCIITSNEEDVDKFKDYVAPKEEEEEEGEKPSKKSSGVAPEAPIAPKMVPIKAAAAGMPPPPPPSRIVSPPAAAAAQKGDRPYASPAAKKLAADRGVDLAQISGGSGMDGMIVAKDVEGFVQPGAVGQPPAGGPRWAGEALQGGVGHTDAEITTMRRVIAKRLQSSKLEVPHYYLTVDCEMDEVMKLRRDINANGASGGKDGKLSVNDFVVKAAALACKQVPTVNSAWMDGFIREYHTCDVSVAVDTGSGLITPIVTSAERKGLAEISQAIREMAERAKQGKLQPHEFQGGTITISNLGMFGVSNFTAIINSPQSCVLAVGATKRKVIPVDDGGATRTANVMSVTLSCDHRVVDGAVGAQWLQKFKGLIEMPMTMLL